MTFNYAGLFAKMQQQERVERVQRLIAGECDIADDQDDELSPEEVASLEAALAEPDFGPFTTEQLASMVDGWAAWEALQAVPSYIEREANQKEV